MCLEQIWEPHPHTLFPPNPSGKILITILLKILQCQHNPPGPRDRHCMLCPGGIYGSYGRDACINFREGSFDWKLKVLAHFSRVKSDWRAGSLLPHVFFSQMHQIKILIRPLSQNFFKGQITTNLVLI
jgi:hypothetical protein